ncbi:MAG: ABC transporter substrate-binding protein [Trueperaceae bacterium]|nr:ABC transporter substrate-binding protein [Trueperaceae bacterium]
MNSEHHARHTSAISPTRPLAVALLLLLALALSGAFAQADDTLTVRARSGADIETMDPAFYSGNEEYNLDQIVFSKLIRYAPGEPEYVLDAAEEFEISDDGTVVEFKLREGIQFHHGYGEMTAEDVKFSYERYLDEDLDSPYASDWGTLDRVEVTGRYSGRIILDEAYAPLLTATLPWTPGSILSQAAFEDRGEAIATQPVGSGPYVWSDWNPNQEIVLERFSEYFGEAPDFERIVVEPITDAQIAEFSFDTRELDATEISLESLDRYDDQEGVAVEVLDTLRYHWLGFNQRHEPFDDVRVREAVRYAVDVDEILQGAYNGVPNRADTMLAPSILGHWEDAPRYEPDLERARELLAEAGYPDGFSTTISTDNVTVHQQSATIVQQQLRRVGIEAEIDIVQDMYVTVSENNTPGLHYASFSAIIDPGYWFEWFKCDQMGQWNYWGWCNEEYDEIHAQASRTADPQERAELYVQLQQIIDEDVSAIWVTNGASVYVYRPDQIDPVFLAMYAQYQYWENLATD